MSSSTNDCSICYSNLADGQSFDLDCNHTFHTKCIMDWFRQGNKKCPLCRAQEEDLNLYPIHFFSCPGRYKCYVANTNWKKTRFNMMKTVCKDKGCPRPLKKALERYSLQKQKHASAKAARIALTKSEDFKTYKRIKKSLISVRTKEFRMKSSVLAAYDKICNMPIIPTKVPIQPVHFDKITKMTKNQTSKKTVSRMVLRSMTSS